jgi:hypothetical protein
VLLGCGTTESSDNATGPGSTDTPASAAPTAATAQPGDVCPFAAMAVGGTIDTPATLGAEPAALLDGQVVITPTGGDDVTASDERDAVQWALGQDSRPLQQKDPPIAVGVTTAWVESTMGWLDLPSGEVMWVVGFFGVLESLISPVGSGGVPELSPAAQRSDLYVFLDTAEGRFLGSLAVPSGSCVSASSRDG